MFVGKIKKVFNKTKSLTLKSERVLSDEQFKNLYYCYMFLRAVKELYALNDWRTEKISVDVSVNLQEHMPVSSKSYDRVPEVLQPHLNKVIHSKLPDLLQEAVEDFDNSIGYKHYDDLTKVLKD